MDLQTARLWFLAAVLPAVKTLPEEDAVSDALAWCTNVDEVEALGDADQAEEVRVCEASLAGATPTTNTTSATIVAAIPLRIRALLSGRRSLSA